MLAGNISDLSDPLERAQFATTARLLSCLVTESLVPAFYQPLRDTDATGFAVILKGYDLLSKPNLDPGDLLAIVPLRHPPIFKDGHNYLGKEIGLLDPVDLAFQIGRGERDFDVHPNNLVSDILLSIKATSGFQLTEQITNDPLVFWNGFASNYNLEANIARDIADELKSTVKWQAYSYEHPPKAPLFTSSSIEWEQSIVEGHPTHPMHKLRRFLSPLPESAPGTYDFLQPQLRFVSVPKTDTKIAYDFEELLSSLVEAASSRAGRPFFVEDGHVLIPVHELQLCHIEDKFPNAIIYPQEFSLPLLAQQSLRSVIISDGFDGLHLKLALGIKLTSAVRTISPESAYFGPRFSAQVVPVLRMDHNIVTVAKELASIVHSNLDGEIAKHCGAIIRECHESSSEERGERLIVCTALVESGHVGTDGHTPSVVRIFDLNTQRKRLEWLERFISIFLQAFLPPMIHNGVAFECHPQNCVARFDLQTKELKGFIVRDFGGLRIHPPTLKATTGVELDFLDGHSIIAETLDDVYTRMYHTIFHNHLQQLIRVLGLHYNGLGWDVVRDALRKNIPSDHPLYTAWHSPQRTTLPGKCFMRMRMASMYRFHLHSPFPNLIHYTGCDEQLESS